MAFLLFAVVAAVTPGPSNVMLTAAGANAGVRKGLPCLLGVATGMGLMMFVVPLGLGSLVSRYPLALQALHWGGALFLLWLSWKIATAGGPAATEDPHGGHARARPGHADPVGYLGAAVFQWVNPKSWLVSVSAAGTFLGEGGASPIVQSASLGALFVLAALPSCFVWLAFGATVQRALRSPRRLRLFNVALGVLLALSIALIVR